MSEVQVNQMIPQVFKLWYIAMKILKENEKGLIQLKVS